MSIKMLSKEKVEKEDPINMNMNLDKSIIEEDKILEDAYELEERSKNNGGRVKSIREKIIDFIKSQGYSHTKKKEEFDDETNDLFAKDDILVDIVIVTGLDNEIIEQMMK